MTTGVMLGTLVPDGVRRAIGWRKVKDGRVIGEGVELLIVRVGPETPCRLLLMHSGDDGLASLSLYELGKVAKMLASEKCLPDLAECVLARWATKFGLSS